MFRTILLALTVTLSLNSYSKAQTRQVMQSGVNRIAVTEYSPRDLTNGELAISMLKEEWDTSSEVRWDITAAIALLAEHVYSDDHETVDFLLRGMGFTKWIAITNETMAAHVVSGDEVAVILFRGTNPTEIPDWYKNLSIAFVENRNGRFHSGFTKAYNSVKAETRRYIDETKPMKLWIAGHSLGGAMAVACGVDLLTTNYKPTLVTFGQPRFADSKGAQWIDEQFAGRYARFVHGDDVVPRVPFHLPRYFPYAHAGNLIAIDEGKLTMENSKLSASGSTASYCGSCGLMTMNAQVDVYQPPQEPPPLTQQQYEATLRPQPMTYSDGTGAVATFSFVPNYFSDHRMTEYRRMVRLYRDRNKVTSRGNVEDRLNQE